QHARRRLADGTATAGEADRLHRSVANPKAQVDLVTAQRIVRLDVVVGRLNRLAVPGISIVVEDDLAIEIVVDRRETDCHALIVVHSAGRQNPASRGRPENEAPW